MDRLREKPAEACMKPYNHSIAIIQSSGMGKSRLVDAIAERKFCFPFNIREPLGSHQYGSVFVIFSIYILSYIAQHTRHPTPKSISTSGILVMNKSLSARISHSSQRSSNVRFSISELALVNIRWMLTRSRGDGENIWPRGRLNILLARNEESSIRKYYKLRPRRCRFISYNFVHNLKRSVGSFRQ
jgi:hypothetical protein